MIPIQMELGGKDACIVCHDADLDLAAKNIVKVLPLCFCLVLWCEHKCTKAPWRALGPFVGLTTLLKAL